MQELDELLIYVNDNFEKLYFERNKLTKDKINIHNKNNQINKEIYNLENLKKISSLIKQVTIIISTIVSVYVSTTMILPSVDNIILTVLSFPMVYLSSNAVLNHFVNEIMYHFTSQTNNSLPVNLELLERTKNDNEIKLREIEVSIDKVDQLLTILSSVDKKINEYKDDQEVEVEFYDIKEEDKIVTFNKSLKLVKDIKKNNKDK